MIASLVNFSLRQRILILGVACIVSIAGVLAFQSLPIDAYPDVTNIQVQVLTEAPGAGVFADHSWIIRALTIRGSEG